MGKTEHLGNDVSAGPAVSGRLVDHEQLYGQVSRECSQLITNRYSTSFSLGIKTLGPSLRAPIYAIYGFVRLGDEIVDTFHRFDKAALLKEFKRDTYLAIERGLSLNPVLHNFAGAVNRYGIERDQIEAFFASMEMDLTKKSYSPDQYRQYVYGSAEVVGLMCLRVFCAGNQAEYERLRESAQRLGAAFQKVNFLRDLESDASDRERFYFPGLTIDSDSFDAAAKRQIEADITSDFEAARAGIDQLPEAARLGVLLAYSYYRKLFDKLKSLSPAEVGRGRVRISDATKARLLAQLMARQVLGGRRLKR